MKPQQELDEFIDKHLPATAAQARACLRIMRARLPGAVQLVYDNYNALVIGFGPAERPSDAVFSLAILPGHVTLCFLQGAKVPDPDRLLQGTGKVARHIRLTGPNDLKRADICNLMTAALHCAKVPFDPGARGKLVIRSISARQRPRRPAQ